MNQHTEAGGRRRGGPCTHRRTDLRREGREDQVINDGTAGWGRRAASRRLMALAGALAAVALLAAACGEGSPASRLAASPGLAQQLAKFARCMRGHGEPNFYYANPQSKPSPSTTGPPLGFFGYIVPGINPDEPPFPAAMDACEHLLPGGGAAPESPQQQLRGLLKFAACMRAHGFPGYPDPEAQSAGPVIGPLPASINTSSPQFQAAQKACHGP